MIGMGVPLVHGNDSHAGVESVISQRVISEGMRLTKVPGPTIKDAADPIAAYHICVTHPRGSI
jgi:hypothetical protein